MNIENQDILVRMLATPNPYALKFVFNVPLKNRGNATFYSQRECEGYPLFHSLFDIKGVRQIYVFQNQMTLSHEGELKDEEIQKQVSSVVGTRMVRHDPGFLSPQEKKLQQSLGGEVKKPVQTHLSPEQKRVEEILDRTVRPGLRADGGDLEVLSVQDGEVQISYQGACGGCPSALMGTLEAIENILRQELGDHNLKVTPVDST